MAYVVRNQYHVRYRIHDMLTNAVTDGLIERSYEIAQMMRRLEAAGYHIGADVDTGSNTAYLAVMPVCQSSSGGKVIASGSGEAVDPGAAVDAAITLAVTRLRPATPVDPPQ